MTENLNIFTISGLLTFFTVSIVIVISLINYRSKLHGVWAVFNVAVGIWGMGAFLIGIAKDPESAYFYWKLAHVGIIFIPTLHYHVSCVFCELPRKKILVMLYLLSFFFLYINMADKFFEPSLRYLFSSLYYIKPSNWYYVFSCIWLTTVIAGTLNYFLTYSQFTGIKKIQIKYFLFVLVFGFSGGLMNFLPVFHIDVIPYGNLLLPIYPIIYTYAILRYRLMDIDVVIKKGMVYSLSAGILTSLFVVIVISMTKFLTDVAGVRSYTILAIASLIIAVLFNPLRNRIQRLVDKKFYKRSYDYYSTIQQVSSTLASMFNKNNIFRFIGNVIYEVMGLECVYVFALIPAEGVYESYYQISKESGVNTKESIGNSAKLNIYERSEVIKLSSSSKDIIVKDELPMYEDKLGKDVVEKIRAEIEELNGEVLVPVFVDGKLSFLIVLGEKLSGDMFTDEDINLLSTIAEQMSVALKNAQFYGNKVQTERLASIGMMSATFAHEIRNPLTSLKTFAQLMPEKYNDPEFRNTFSKIVEGEIEKIDTLIGDLLDFSTEKKSARVNDFNLVELVDETLEYIKGKFTPQKENIDVVRRYHERVINMSGDATKLKQAFGIIITNGYQAMNGSGKLTVDIKMNNEGVDVAISDTGEGIPHEDISRIFDPFVTTKEMGVGLGLAITKRVIEDHEGKIHVRSRLGEGTTFTISLRTMKESYM